MAPFESLPYRPCAGLAVLSRTGLAFIGRRIDGPEHVDNTHVWQMPQGGVDPGEDPWPAALRELREETAIRSVEQLGEIEDWLTYDIPREIVGQAWKGKYRGQTQKWYALRFTGDEREIDIVHPAGGHKAEFDAWRWEPMRNLPTLIIPFKRKVYEHRQTVRIDFREPAVDDDAERAGFPMQHEDSRPQRCHQWSMAREHAEVALGARHVDLIDRAGEQEFLGRNQIELERGHQSI